MKRQESANQSVKLMSIFFCFIVFVSSVLGGNNTYLKTNNINFKTFETPNDGLLLYSLHSSNNLNDKSLEFQKMDNDGNIEWKKTHSISMNFKLSCIQQFKNNYLIIGYIINNSTNYDIHALSMSKLGEIEWQKTYNQPGIEIPDFIFLSEDENIIVTGFCASPLENSLNTITNDIFLMKISKTGKMKWVKTLGLDGVDEEPLQIKKISNSEYLLVANRKHFQDNFFLVKFNDFGKIIWEETYSINGFFKNNLDVTLNNNNCIITSNIQVYSPQNNIISTSTLSLEINMEGEKINSTIIPSNNIDYVYVDTLNKISVNILRGIINRPDVNMRAEPTLNSNIISCLNEGEVVEIIEKTNDPQKIGSMNEHWYRLKLGANTDGWIYGFFLDVIK